MGFLSGFSLTKRGADGNMIVKAYILQREINVNIYDIAREAGVSIATVSRVLNNKGTVSAVTRQKVEAVLNRHHYTPSAIAQGMVSKSMRTVAVLTVNIRVAHYARTAYTIEREFSRRGYEVILCNTGGDREATLKYLRAVTKKQVDGIVLVGSVFNRIGRDPEIEALLRTAPVVLANGRLELPNSYSVLVDDEHGVALAVEHLYAKGRRELFYIKDMNTASADLKLNGFLIGMRRCGLEAEGHVLYTQDSIEGGISAVQELRAGGRPFDGIVCGEDITAVGVVKGLLRAGISIPEQVAVTGYNNSIYAHLCEPELTGIDNKPEQVALLCVQLLESLMDKTDIYSSVTIQPELVQGQTT